METEKHIFLHTKNGDIGHEVPSSLDNPDLGDAIVYKLLQSTKLFFLFHLSFLLFGDGVVLRLSLHLHCHHLGQLLGQLLVPFWTQPLCQSICHHFFHWRIFQSRPSVLHTVSDEMILF
jgi:hypothetical protein